MTMTSQLFDIKSSSNFFNLSLFFLLGLATGSSFMSMSLLVLELWQLSFLRDWQEIWRLEIAWLGFSHYMETGEG